MALIVKCTKESILAAKIIGGIRLYIVPAPEGAPGCAGVITAFFDDEDEPLTLTSPLFERDPFATDVVALLEREAFDVHLVDENNHELLGYHARNPAFMRFQKLAPQLKLSQFSLERARDLHNYMGKWFGLRTVADDDNAFSIEFAEPLFPEDIFIADVLNSGARFHAAKPFLHTTLERRDAGPLQEMDIVRLLQRTFPAEQIYLNPMRTDHPGLEFVDVMVLTDNYLYLLQAKDSPNTEPMMRRTVERKRATSLAHLAKAVSQIGGAINHARSVEPITLTTGSTTHKVSVQSRTIIGIAVLKEMFDADATAYAEPVLKLVEDEQVPCVVMDYAQLHAFTLNLTTETAFLDGIQAALDAALKNGIFPRLRFGLIEE